MDIPEERSRSIALMKLLLEDVMAARERLGSADTQVARRDIVRASIAAMEGMMWLAREHVRDVLNTFDELTPIADLALREQTYVVSENGKLFVQGRSIPLPTAIRFIASQAAIISPDIDVEFSVVGWSNLKQSISIRNRITHPKPGTDLQVSDRDLEQVASALSWLTATVDYVMASTNLSLIEYGERAKDLVERLIAGEPEALADYQIALGQLGEEDT